MKKLLILWSFASILFVGSASALELDWSGQFRAEAVMLNHYAPENNISALNVTETGYEVKNVGSRDARFQTLFLRLKPKAVINDNLAIKSEVWFGNPVTGFYGSDYPGTGRSDQTYYNGNYTGGSNVSAQRFWAEYVTDIGLLQVGRAPLHWGLGVVHNSGDGLFDRYQTTGDLFRLNAKFGNFSVIPAIVKYSNGNTVSSSTYIPGSPQNNTPGNSNLNEYIIGLKYESPEEDFEGGVNFVRRVAGVQSQSLWINGQAGGLNYTIWDIYGKKRAGKFDFGFEAPIYNGNIDGTTYKAFAIVTELGYKPSDTWNFTFKVGHVPGQPNNTSSTPDKWSMVTLNPDYKIGLIMFNYQFRNFRGPNTGSSGTMSIYDNPVTDARYGAIGAVLNADKWSFTSSLLMASAPDAAKAGSYYYNNWTRKYDLNPAVEDQSTSLGTEFDLGMHLNWDEYSYFALDTGFYFPGGFYKFTNTATDQTLGMVFGAVASFGVKF